MLVRELDERLGLAKFIAEDLNDSRHGLNTQFGLADSITAIGLQQGDCLAAKLRPSNVHSADDWDELLAPEIDRQQAEGKHVAIRANAAFAKPEIYQNIRQLAAPSRNADAISGARLLRLAPHRPTHHTARRARRSICDRLA